MLTARRRRLTPPPSPPSRSYTENLFENQEYRQLRRAIPNVVPTATLEAAESVLRKCAGAGLPAQLRSATLKEIFFGRRPTGSESGFHGVLSMDACVIEGPLASRDALLQERFVGPVLRAVAQQAVEDRDLAVQQAGAVLLEAAAEQQAAGAAGACSLAP